MTKSAPASAITLNSKFSLGVLAALYVMVAPAAAETQNAQLDALIARHLEWSGAAGAAPVESLDRSGEICILGICGPLRMRMRADGYRLVEYTIRNKSGSKVLTPDDGWEEEDGKVRQMSPDEQANMREALEFAGTGGLNDPRVDIKLLAPERRKGKTYSVIRMTYPSGNTVDMFLNSDGSLDWARLHSGKIKAWKHLMDWRLVDGHRISFKRVNSHGPTPFQRVTMTFDKVALNTEMPTAIFIKPAE